MPAKGGRGGGYRGTSTWMVTMLCIASFCVGTLITNRIWYTFRSDHGDGAQLRPPLHDLEAQKRLENYGKAGDSNDEDGYQKDILSECSQINSATKDLHNTVSSLKMELEADGHLLSEKSRMSGSPKVGKVVQDTNKVRPKAFMVIGINTGFTSQERRDAIRATWMPKFDTLRRLEGEQGIIIRFVIGRNGRSSSSSPNLVIEAEDAIYKDFLRLEHFEGYHKLTAKTKSYIATAFAKWDADFYVKVDDDIHVNLGSLATTLAHYAATPRVYIGCMKSGPVLTQRSDKYYEPEFWKFGDKYFAHATGQIYAISNDLASHVSKNQPILHEFANEDVSLGSWLLGLDVEQVDDRTMCCGAPSDCERKAKAGNVCAASFDWTCSGICEVKQMKDVHQRCGEEDGAVWNSI
ncbi:unnamed protein product [Calypogeia fissa]